jgi:hypothetical protein
MTKKIPASWSAPTTTPRPTLVATPPPEAVNRTITLRTTASPRTDRHVQIRTLHRNWRPIYVVGVVDGFGHYAPDYPTPREFATPDEARAYANRLLTKERNR